MLSVSSKHWSVHRSSCMPLSKSHRELWLEHSDAEILKEVPCIVTSPKDPFSAKYCRFQDGGSSVSALKSFWFFVGKKLKGMARMFFSSKVLSRQIEITEWKLTYFKFPNHVTLKWTIILHRVVKTAFSNFSHLVHTCGFQIIISDCANSDILLPCLVI